MTLEELKLVLEQVEETAALVTRASDVCSGCCSDCFDNAANARARIIEHEPDCRYVRVKTLLIGVITAGEHANTGRKDDAHMVWVSGFSSVKVVDLKSTE